MVTGLSGATGADGSARPVRLPLASGGVYRLHVSSGTRAGPRSNSISGTARNAEPWSSPSRAVSCSGKNGRLEGSVARLQSRIEVLKLQIGSRGILNRLLPWRPLPSSVPSGCILQVTAHQTVDVQLFAFTKYDGNQVRLLPL